MNRLSCYFLYLLSLLQCTSPLIARDVITQATAQEAPIFISLGKDCEPARNIQGFKLRKKAYPFDWINTYTLNTTCALIENRFADFLNPVFLKKDHDAVLNTKYKIHLRHDFPTISAGPHYAVAPEPQDTDHLFYRGLIVDNFLDFLGEITEKYDRRIKRLFELLDSKSTIIFIQTGAKPEETRQFTELMAKNHPLITYTLLVIHGDPVLNYDWNIPNVHSYYLEKKHEHHATWVHPDEWKQLFIQLGYERWVAQ